MNQENNATVFREEFARKLLASKQSKSLGTYKEIMGAFVEKEGDNYTTYSHTWESLLEYLEADERQEGGRLVNRNRSKVKNLVAAGLLSESKGRPRVFRVVLENYLKAIGEGRKFVPA